MNHFNLMSQGTHRTQGRGHSERAGDTLRGHASPSRSHTKGDLETPVKTLGNSRENTQTHWPRGITQGSAQQPKFIQGKEKTCKVTIKISQSWV